MRVVGTAGHVDHGKSTLVQALSGIHPDRLKEEKARGLTIDLGFAWIDLTLSNGTQESVGIVDVPGHIDFIKNMLAGVGGIDAAVLVIASDEGVMPQTREHLAILDLLSVPSAMVALTKIDLVDEPEWLDLVELDIVELLEETQFANAPIVRLDAVSGAGLEEFKRTLAGVLHELPPRRNRERPRLPIDRVFSLSGFGTIVTGTLADGQLSVGDAVEILPTGLPARVRGLQSHKQSIRLGQPGSRLAVNLTGVATEVIHRGHVVVRPGTVEPTRMVDVSFRYLDAAPKPLKHNINVDFFSGAAEVPARVRLLGEEQLRPGTDGWLQLRLEMPVVVTAGDRFILRQPSPSLTLGGGVILNAHPARRWRRFDDNVLARLSVLAEGDPEEILFDALARLPLINLEDWLSASALDAEIGRMTVQELEGRGAVAWLGEGSSRVYMTKEFRHSMVQTLSRLVTEYHEHNPLRRGMPKGELFSRIRDMTQATRLTTRLFGHLLAQLADDGLLVADDTVVAWHDHQIHLTARQREEVDQLLTELAKNRYAPPNAGELLAMLGDDDALLEMLVDEGTLVRLDATTLFRGEDFASMASGIKQYIQDNGSITLAETRDLFATSRKYAQSVLEELDRRRVTVRQGDSRVLRPGA